MSNKFDHQIQKPYLLVTENPYTRQYVLSSMIGDPFASPFSFSTAWNPRWINFCSGQAYGRVLNDHEMDNSANLCTKVSIALCMWGSSQIGKETFLCDVWASAVRPTPCRDVGAVLSRHEVTDWNILITNGSFSQETSVNLLSAECDELVFSVFSAFCS
jgi:hypothetical protein